MPSRTVLRSFAAAVVLAAATGLSGCFLVQDRWEPRPNEGTGQTEEELEAALESSPAVAAADFRYRAWESPGEGGLGASSGYDYVLDLTLEPGLYPQDVAGLADYLLRLMWTPNEYILKGSAEIVLHGTEIERVNWADGVPGSLWVPGVAGFEVLAPGEEWEPEGLYGDADPVVVEEGTVVLSMGGAQNLADLTGERWAGPVPDADIADFLGSDLGDPAPATLRRVGMMSVSGGLATDCGGSTCTSVSASLDRLALDEGYAGTVTGRLVAGGEDLGVQTWRVPDDEQYDPVLVWSVEGTRLDLLDGEWELTVEATSESGFDTRSWTLTGG